MKKEKKTKEAYIYFKVDPLLKEKFQIKLLKENKKIKEIGPEMIKEYLKRK